MNRLTPASSGEERGGHKRTGGAEGEGVILTEGRNSWKKCLSISKATKRWEWEVEIHSGKAAGGLPQLSQVCLLYWPQVTSAELTGWSGRCVLARAAFPSRPGLKLGLWTLTQRGLAPFQQTHTEGANGLMSMLILSIWTFCDIHFTVIKTRPLQFGWVCLVKSVVPFQESPTAVPIV